MKPTVVYSVVCNEGNRYLEQLQLSLYSLRRTNPDAGIVIVCDIDSKDYISFRIKEPDVQIMAVPCPGWMDPMCRSRYLKVSLRNIISGDFLYIDNDTVILEPLEGLDIKTCDMAAVPDNHHGPKPQDQRLYYMMKTRSTLKKTNSVFFNSGVMFVRDTSESRRFYKEWLEAWMQFAVQGVYFDQLALNEILSDKKNADMILELPGEWNCQITRDASAEYKARAKIVHYQSSSIQYLFDMDFDSIYREIRNTNQLPDRIKVLIDDKTFSRIRYKIEPSNLAGTYFESPLFILLHYDRRFFNFIEKISINYMSFTLSPLGKLIGAMKAALKFSSRTNQKNKQ